MAAKKAKGSQGAADDRVDAVPVADDQPRDVEPDVVADTEPTDGYIPAEPEAAPAVDDLFHTDKIAAFAEPVRAEAPAADIPAAETDGEVTDEGEGVPTGEELAEHDLPAPDPFEMIDEDAEELTDLAIPATDVPDDAVAAEAASSRPVRRARPIKAAETPSEIAAALEDEEEGFLPDLTATTKATATASKNRPTRSRAEATASDAPKGTSPAMFVRQVVQELKKVSWPTSAQLIRFFAIVLGFVVFLIAFIGVLDYGFGALMLKLFG